MNHLFPGYYRVLIIGPIIPCPSPGAGVFHGIVLTRGGSVGLEGCVAQPPTNGMLHTSSRNRQKRVIKNLDLGAGEDHHVAGLDRGTLRSAPRLNVGNGSGRFNGSHAQLGNHAATALDDERGTRDNALLVPNA